MANTPTSVPVNSSLTSGSITFTLGSSLNDPSPITFGEPETPTSVSSLEIPGKFSSLGGTQRNAVHEFPGGIKTVQALGAFPVPLSWRGVLLGGNAFARSFQLDTLRRTGGAAFLSLGPWRWQGLVREYLGEVLHQNRVEYKITFEPIVDLTASGQAQAPTVSTVQSTISTLLTNIVASYTIEVILSAASEAALGEYCDAASTLLEGMSAGISAFSASDVLSLESATDNAQAALALDIQSTDPQVAATAVGVSGAVDAVTASFLSAQVATTINVVNPNLLSVASQYLGDASRWTDIATLNGLTDTEPMGNFALQIPSA